MLVSLTALCNRGQSQQVSAESAVLSAEPPPTEAVRKSLAMHGKLSERILLSGCKLAANAENRLAANSCVTPPLNPPPVRGTF